MNKHFDLTEILKDCPEGAKLYSTVHGEVSFISSINDDETSFPITVRLSDNAEEIFTADGKLYTHYRDGECILFPSRDQRDWSKFKAPWYKKERFDPNTLHPYDKVLVRDNDSDTWRCAFYSHQRGSDDDIYRFSTSDSAYVYGIPYNDDTKHLAGTAEEAPEFYRYWED